MKLTISQENQLKELFKTVELLFNNNEFGLMYSEIEEAWIIGDSLRDILILKNPVIYDYTFYIQVKNLESIYPWLSRLAEKKVTFEILEKPYTFNKEEIFQRIALSLKEYDIDYEITILIGNLSPKKFIMNNAPITLSLLGLDIADLFVYLSEKNKLENLNKQIWFDQSYKKDVRKKTITVLKQKWMSNIESYKYLEIYLEKTHNKLNKIGFK